MDIDGSLVGAGVTGVVAIVTVVGGLGKQAGKINSIGRSMDKLEQEFSKHEKDYADRMARLETLAENQNTWHSKLDDKLERLLDR